VHIVIGFVTGFAGQLYNSWLNFADHYHTQTSALSHVAWQRLPSADISLLLSSRPCRVATISRQPHTLTAGFSQYSLQLLAPRAGLTSNCQSRTSAANSRLASNCRNNRLFMKPRRGAHRKHRLVCCLTMALVLLLIYEVVFYRWLFLWSLILAVKTHVTI
jgi:hypothetical protein